MYIFFNTMDLIVVFANRDNMNCKCCLSMPTTCSCYYRWSAQFAWTITRLRPTSLRYCLVVTPPVYHACGRCPGAPSAVRWVHCAKLGPSSWVPGNISNLSLLGFSCLLELVWPMYGWSFCNLFQNTANGTFGFKVWLYAFPLRMLMSLTRSFMLEVKSKVLCLLLLQPFGGAVQGLPTNFALLQ